MLVNIVGAQILGKNGIIFSVIFFMKIGPFLGEVAKKSRQARF